MMFESNTPGVLAVGDVWFAANRRVANAVGGGTVAIYSVHKHLEPI
jgi:thioredoxin reductase